MARTAKTTKKATRKVRKTKAVSTGKYLKLSNFIMEVEKFKNEFLYATKSTPLLETQQTGLPCLTIDTTEETYRIAVEDNETLNKDFEAIYNCLNR